MSFTITITPDNSTVIMHAYGHFDMSQGFALWNYCQPENGNYKNYIINLREVKELRDSGLGWLMAFQRYARSINAGVRIITANSAFQHRLGQIGVSFDDNLPVREAA